MNTLFHLVLVLSLVSSFIRCEGILFSLFKLSDVFWLRNLNFIVFALLFAERVTVAEEVLKLCNGSVISPIACIACPNLYAYLKNMDSNVPAQLFEYDKRFEQYRCDYTFYNNNHPKA
ncbi:hypothetical protein AHAS_Ahas01G0105300 [Arachis hypogaea]